MRADFSSDLQKKMEEKSLFRKTTIRVLTLSLFVGIVSCLFFFNSYQGFIPDITKGGICYLITVILFSVLLGSMSALVVFFNIFIHLKRVINELTKDKPRWDWLESEYIESDIQDAYLAIKKLHVDVSSHAKMAGVYEIASQVAHDIKSPLIALELVVKSLSGVPEEYSNLIKNAMDRIKDMASNLLPSKMGDEDTINLAALFNSELILQVLIDIVSEKKHEYRHDNIKINLHIDKKAYWIFSSIDRHQFQRIVSNIINNGVDSIESVGEINILLEISNGFIDVIVKDNGCGIPIDILPEIKRSRFTYNKKSGSGLGLYHANEYLKTVGGELLISSEISNGTTVTIRLPVSSTPSCFCNSIYVYPNSKILIVSDDCSFNSAFVGMLSGFHSVTALCCFTLNELEEHLVNIDKIYLVIFDHNVKSAGISVVDFVVDTGLSCKSLIITNQYIDKKYQEILIENKIKIVPKKVIEFIKNDFFQYESHYVLIDNSQIVIDTWTLKSYVKNINFNGFTDVNEFLSFINTIDKKTNIYIDFNLECDVNGKDLAMDVYSKGFENLYLCTGYEKNEFQPMGFIKDVVGKEPPF